MSFNPMCAAASVLPTPICCVPSTHIPPNEYLDLCDCTQHVLDGEVALLPAEISDHQPMLSAEHREEEGAGTSPSRLTCSHAAQRLSQAVQRAGQSCIALQLGTHRRHGQLAYACKPGHANCRIRQ